MIEGGIGGGSMFEHGGVRSKEDVVDEIIEKVKHEYPKQSDISKMETTESDLLPAKVPTSDEVLTAVKEIRAFVPAHQIDTIGSQSTR